MLLLLFRLEDAGIICPFLGWACPLLCPFFILGWAYNPLLSTVSLLTVGIGWILTERIWRWFRWCPFEAVYKERSKWNQFDENFSWKWLFGKKLVEIYRASFLPRVEAVGGRLPVARSRLTRFGDILLFLAHCSNSALLNSSKVSLRFRLFLWGHISQNGLGPGMNKKLSKITTQLVLYF